MQFASKMMLVPYNKDAYENCINKRRDGNNILKSKKLSSADKLIRYREIVGNEKRNQKSKAHKTDNKKEDSETQTQSITETTGQASSGDETYSYTTDDSKIEKNEQQQQLQQLQQQLNQQQELNKKLKQEHKHQLRIAKEKPQGFNLLANKVSVSSESPSRSTRKRKIVELPDASSQTFASEVVRPKKLLTSAIVNKLDIMPEEADKDPNFPSLGIYDRQFVEPNKRSTRSILNWKKF